MGCSKCGQKEQLKKEIFSATKSDEKKIYKWVILFVVTTLYGIVSMIIDIINVFL